MASNVDVDYDDMVKKANNIATYASIVNKDICNVYQEIKEMKNVWYGASYDRFVNTSNYFIPDLDKLFRFIVTEGPAELAAKAVSYARGDLSTVNHTGNKSPKKIENVPLSNKAPKLRFQPQNISSAREQMERNFSEAEQECDTIVHILDSVEWESVAASSTKSKMKTSINNVKSIIGKIRQAMSTIITQQTTTINAIEGAAEAVEAGKDIILDMISDKWQNAQQTIQEIGENAHNTWRSMTGKD